MGLMPLAHAARGTGSRESEPRGTVEPVTVSQVIDMSKASMPSDEIIAKIRASGTIYRLDASQLADLRDQGVPNPVIDYMRQTYLNAIRRDQALEDQSRWTLEADQYGYGGLPYGWPYYPDDFIIGGRDRDRGRRR